MMVKRKLSTQHFLFLNIFKQRQSILSISSVFPKKDDWILYFVAFAHQRQVEILVLISVFIQQWQHWISSIHWNGGR